MSYFGNVSVTQNVISDPNNSWSTAIGANETWVGTGTTTLGVAGIQVSLKTDKNCEVYIEQSPDNINWDISDSYTYATVINNFGVTVQAVNSYVRVRVENLEAAATTIFRLQTALCPVVEALPRSLDENLHLLTSVHNITDEYGNEVENTAMGEMRVAQPTKLVGATFDGYVLDENFWLSGATSTGNIAVSGQCILSTGVSLSGGTYIETIRTGRYLGGVQNRYRAICRLNNSGTTGNYRRWGAFNSNNGCYFELSGTTLSACVRKGGVDTKVSSDNWNQWNIAPNLTNVFTSEIYWTNSGVKFSIGGEYVHNQQALTDTWSETLTLPCRTENYNTSSTNDNQIFVRTQTIYRLGVLSTASIYKFINANGTYILKRGAGRLLGIIFGVAGSNNNTMNIYDSATGTATNQIAGLNSAAITVGTGVFSGGLDFFNGLTIILATGTAPYLTIIYE